MHKRLIVRPWAAAVLGVALVVGACGASASPSPSPTATPSPTPSPTPTAAPSASGPVDPAADLAIAAPYTLQELDPASASTIQAAMEKGMGAFTSVIHVGTRTVSKAGATVGYVMVIAFPPGTLTETTYKAVIAGITASSGAPLTDVKVNGFTVSTGTMSGISVGAFMANESVVLVLSPAASEVVPIATALIAANK